MALISCNSVCSVQGAPAKIDRFVAGAIPEQVRATGAAEPAPRRVSTPWYHRGTLPLISRPHRAGRRCCGHMMPAGLAALLAVTGDRPASRLPERHDICDLGPTKTGSPMLYHGFHLFQNAPAGGHKSSSKIGPIRRRQVCGAIPHSLQRGLPDEPDRSAISGSVRVMASCQ